MGRVSLAVINWEWDWQKVSPPAIVDAARTICKSTSQVLVEMVPDWIPAARYLEWARVALDRNSDDGWDAAASLAKRAVCRQMDGVLLNNHLACVVRKKNRAKANALQQLGIPGLSLLQSLVIDPRNQLEHAYDLAAPEQARHAVDVADLFLRATEKRGNEKAGITLGWEMSRTERGSSEPGQEYHLIDYRLDKNHGPFLLVTVFEAPVRVIVACPQNETAVWCAMTDFQVEDALPLSRLLRSHASSTSTYKRGVSPTFIGALREQLKLTPP
jgi:hypothetical protein